MLMNYEISKCARMEYLEHPEESNLSGLIAKLIAHCCGHYSNTFPDIPKQSFCCCLTFTGFLV